MNKTFERVGVVDAGSNSFILLIAEKSLNGIKYLLDLSTVVGMGKILYENGEERLLLAKKVMKRYHKIMEEYDVSKRVIIGTEIFRKLPSFYFEELSIEFDKAIVLNGEEEARLSYLSVVEDEKLSIASPLVVDVGGGSVEYSYNENGKTKFESFPIGARVLTSRFVKTYPIKDQLKSAQKYVEGCVGYLPKLQLVSIGGSGTTLAALLKKVNFSSELHGTLLSVEEVEEAFLKVSRLKLEEIVKLKGMERGREEIIATGILIILVSMMLSSNEYVTISVRGHRYAVAKKMLLEGGIV